MNSNESQCSSNNRSQILDRMLAALLDVLSATKEYKIGAEFRAGRPLSNAPPMNIVFPKIVVCWSRYTCASTKQTAPSGAESSLYRPDTFLSLWAPRTGVTSWNAAVTF